MPSRFHPPQTHSPTIKTPSLYFRPISAVHSQTQREPHDQDRSNACRLIFWKLLSSLPPSLYPIYLFPSSAQSVLVLTTLSSLHCLGFYTLSLSTSQFPPSVQVRRAPIAILDGFDLLIFDDVDFRSLRLSIFSFFFCMCL